MDLQSLMTSEAVILVVDDDPNDVLFLKRAFGRIGVRQPVTAVHDGQEAITYLAGKGKYGDRTRYPLPCLVLLDIKLPRMNGLEVLRWLRGREEFHELPVCILSSSDDARDREEAGKHGIEAYCVKPVAFDDLIRLAEKIRKEAEDHCEKPTPSWRSHPRAIP